MLFRCRVSARTEDTPLAARPATRRHTCAHHRCSDSRGSGTRDSGRDAEGVLAPPSNRQLCQRWSYSLRLEMRSCGDNKSFTSKNSILGD